MLECKPADTPMEPNLKLAEQEGSPHVDKERYQRLARLLCPYIGNKTSRSRTELNSPEIAAENSEKLLHKLKQIQAQMVIDNGFAASRFVPFCALSESGYVGSGDLEGAFMLYKRMLRCGVLKPDNHTYPMLLKACSCQSLNCVGFGILAHMLKFGFEFDIFVHIASITMLLPYGELRGAYDMFDKSHMRDLVTWNSMITGIVRRGPANKAIKIYNEMVAEKLKSNEITMIGMISSCSQLQDLNLGREFHCYIEEHGLELTVLFTNALMDM
ncbi:pentatricopeptide repeat-containing protein At2g22410, mitochondrial-like [Cicer arietinum]|uniref:pentatricopeptide repeat-containing protein At2g22410, mitochondrial-like n=1 Tax=Cicer arietinum TaxID=3827 RepID=UPI003CC5D649